MQGADNQPSGACGRALAGACLSAVQTHLLPDGSVHAAWSGKTRASPLAAWESFSDTDRLNRLAGFDWKFEVTEVRGGGVERLGWFRWLGMKQLWEERPYRWVAPREYGVERVFRGGPIKSYRTHLDIQADPAGGASLNFEMTWRPRASLLARPIAHSIRTGGGAQLAQAMDKLVSELDGAARLRLPGPPPLPPATLALLDERLASVGPPELARGLRELIRTGSISAQDRIQPLRIAEEWGLQASAAVLGMIAAANAGVLEPSWGVLCPSCHGPKHRMPTLEEATGVARCDHCELEFEGSPRDGVALSFRTHPEIRNIQLSPACLGSPGRTPHIVLRQPIEPGQESVFRPILRPGRYRLRVWPALDAADLVVSAQGGPSSVTVTLADDGLCPAVLRCSAGEVQLHVRSARADRRDIVLERRYAPPYALTASHLESIPQAFELLQGDSSRTVLTQIPAAYVLVAEAFRGRGQVVSAVQDLLTPLSPLHIGRQDRRVYAAWHDPAAALAGAGALAGALDVCSALAHGLVSSPAPSGPAVDKAIAALHTAIPGATAVDKELTGEPEMLAALGSSDRAGHLVQGPALDGHQAWLLSFEEPGEAADRLSAPPLGGRSVGERLGDVSRGVGSRIAGRYLLDHLIASGGFGAVHAATDLRSGEPVVVKTMHSHYVDDPTDLQRFFNEARLASRLVHPNTVRTLDFGHTDDGRLYIVLERLSGRDLDVALIDQAHLPAQFATDIGVGVLRALAEAHEQGLVHRDLKPANIFIVDSAVGEQAIRVIDFGIAKELSGDDMQLTQANMVVGTMLYMPPEPLLGAPLGPTGDLYSLGLVLYRCLAGHVPFGNLQGFGPVLQRIEQETPELRQASPDPAAVPQALSDVVMRSLQRRPEDRWQTADEMRHALQAAV